MHVGVIVSPATDWEPVKGVSSSSWDRLQQTSDLEKGKVDGCLLYISEDSAIEKKLIIWKLFYTFKVEMDMNQSEAQAIVLKQN